MYVSRLAENVSTVRTVTCVGCYATNARDYSSNEFVYTSADVTASAGETITVGFG